jgi:hypothetical protein
LAKSLKKEAAGGDEARFEDSLAAARKTSAVKVERGGSPSSPLLYLSLSFSLSSFP